jgi:hypothetical protein
MKILIFSIIFVLSIFIACPGQAQLAVYDDFSEPFLDTARWRNATSWGDNVWPYEGGFRILKKKLSFFNRAYGAVLVDDGIQSMKRQLFLRDVSGVTGLEASIQVVKNGHEITGCSTENDEPSETRVWIGGSFFNGGSGTPNSGNYTGDILVGIGLYKYSNSDDIPAGYMGVRSRVFQCLSADCNPSARNTLNETFFPDKNGKPLLLKVGKKEKFRITYDKPTNTFTFQVGKKNIVSFECPVANAEASGAVNGGMRIEVTHDLANCHTAETRSIGWADVLFDDVLVDEE